MTKIAYDPVKDRFAQWIRHSRFLRTLFYQILDIFFLRSWYVRSALRKQYKSSGHQKEKWNILDAGCGFGQYDRFMLKSFPNATLLAVDIKKDYLNDCEFYFKKEIEEGRITFQEMDLVTDPLPEAVFHLALCVDVLEHIEEDVAVMKRIEKSLRPGGIFMMHSPSHYSSEDAGEEDFFVDEHARAGYSKEELTKKLKQAGLTPVSIKYSYGKWGHRAWRILIKTPMLWFTRYGMATLFWLPFYYMLTILPGLVMMFIDCHSNNKRGTGIFSIAEKKPVS